MNNRLLAALHKTWPPIGPMEIKGRPKGSIKTVRHDPDRLRQKVIYVEHSIDPGQFEAADRDNACWILHLVQQHHRVKNLASSRSVPLAQKYLKPMLTYKHQQAALALLIERGIIERRPSEGRCAYYGFTTPYQSDRYIPHEITATRLLDRLYKHQLERESSLRLPVHRRLYSLLERIAATPDAPDDAALDAIRRGNLWASVCDKGRFHSTLTRLPKEFRSHIRIEGYDDLVTSDVSHCQFVLLACWLQAQGIAVDAEFKIDAIAGGLYHRFGEAVGCKRDRNKAKKRIISTLFGYPRERKYNPKYVEAFSLLYPHTWAAVDAYVRSAPAANLACVLQRYESTVMIEGAAAAFTEQYPDVPLLTLHDGFVVPRAFADEATRCITDAFRTLCGVVPTVKIDKFESKPGKRTRRLEREKRVELRNRRRIQAVVSVVPQSP